MSIQVKSMKCEERFVEPEERVFVAELKCTEWIYDREEVIYLSVTNEYDENTYVASCESVFDYLDGKVEELDEFESYDYREEITKSRYLKQFIYLEKTVEDLYDNLNHVIVPTTYYCLRTHNIHIKDENQYYLVASDELVVNDNSYKAVVCYGTLTNGLGQTKNVLDISLLDEDGKLIEGYEDFDAAMDSEYIIVYYDLKNFLKEAVAYYLNAHPELDVNPDFFEELFEPEN